MKDLLFSNTYVYLSRGVLPENLRRGPYAVVERAVRAKPLLSYGIFSCNLKCHEFGYFFSLLYLHGEMPQVWLLFLDPCICPVGLKYANKRKDAKTQTLVKSEFSTISIRLRILAIWTA